MKQKGFTLIELIIVIAIIGILAAIAIPNYINFQNRAKDSGIKESLGAYRTALAMYFGDNGSYPAALSGVATYLDTASADKNFINSATPSYTAPGGTTYTLTASGWAVATFTATPGGIAP